MKEDVYKGIRKELTQIIQGTEWEGHVYLVGGCVRDEIMQKKIHDIDIAIDLPNGGINFALWLHQHHHAGRKPLLFEHFGTAKVRLHRFPREVIDCVQTRRTKYEYEEQPCPEKNFGTIEEDAACRDITINSLYLNLSTEQLLDPTGYGIHDIEHHIIRTPNIPDISLRDNAMHILRTIRFSVRYNWPLEPEIIESMKRNIDIIREATPTRMTKELTSIFMLRHKDKAFAMIRSIGAWDIVEPFINAVHKEREHFFAQQNKKNEAKNTRRNGADDNDGHKTANRRHRRRR